MHPPPIKVTQTKELPHDAVYVETLESGERIYRCYGGAIYALQPTTTPDRRPGLFDLRKELGRAPTAQEWRDARRSK
jgi:hypothetical protein